MLTHQFIQHMFFKVSYGIFVFTFAIWLSIKPKRNPKKRNYQVIQFALKRDRNVYHMFLPSEVSFFDSEEEQQFDKSVVLDLTHSINNEGGELTDD